MHGVRRGSRPTGAAAREEEEIARQQAAVVQRALALRATGDHSEVALEVVARALTYNPEEYSLWAFRREALLALLAPPSVISGVGNGSDSFNVESQSEEKVANEPASARFVKRWKGELELGLAALRRHPKAYSAWHHRLWLLSNHELAAVLPKDLRCEALRSEFSMSGFLLSQDGRNFHGWAHRMRTREVALTSAVPACNTPSDELAFVTEKINDDFANYSAWHHRSALLPTLYRRNPESSEGSSFIDVELDFVRQAFYTEPDVQSAWFFHRWLLAGAPARGNKAVVDDSVCHKELIACEELLEIEPNARWALHAQAHLLVRLKREEEARPIFQRLAKLDPMRQGYYNYQMRKLKRN